MYMIVDANSNYNNELDLYCTAVLSGADWWKYGS